SASRCGQPGAWRSIMSAAVLRAAASRNDSFRILLPSGNARPIFHHALKRLHVVLLLRFSGFLQALSQECHYFTHAEVSAGKHNACPRKLDLDLRHPDLFPVGIGLGLAAMLVDLFTRASGESHVEQFLLLRLAR